MVQVTPPATIHAWPWNSLYHRGLVIALMVLKGYFFIDLTTVNACRLDGLHGIPPPPSASSDSPSLQEPMGEAFRVLTRHEARTQVEFGKVERWEGFNWGKLLPRTVEVWLPPKPYWDQVSPLPVWYLHDGQNLMDPKIGYGGQSWQLDSLMQVHLADGSIPPCLLVLIDNSSRRFEDYLPPPCLEGLAEPLHRTLQAERQGTALGREYGRWISQELKPWIGLNYPVVADPAAHYLMGASMGGLISSYLLAAYPEHFGGAACLSTHWPLSLKQQDLGLSQPYRSWLAQELDSWLKPRNPWPGMAIPGQAGWRFTPCTWIMGTKPWMLCTLLTKRHLTNCYKRESLPERLGTPHAFFRVQPTGKQTGPSAACRQWPGS